MAELRVGYFADFYDPTLLLWGDEAGLNALASFLVGLVEGGSVALTEQPWVRPRGALRVTIALSAEPLGLAQERETPPAFRWTLSEDHARDFAEKVRGVAAAGHPCHHYLDTDQNEAAVAVVSRGEYDHL